MGQLCNDLIGQTEASETLADAGIEITSIPASAISSTMHLRFVYILSFII